jgi:hypothetical protein
MHISTKSGALVSVAALVLLALSTTCVSIHLQSGANLTSSAVIAQASAKTYVTILSSVGGTSSPAPGNYTYPAGTLFTITASAAEGFSFDSWVFASANSQEDLIVSGSDWTQNSTTANPLTIQCESGCLYVVQAVFRPVGKGAESLPSGLNQLQVTASIAFLAALCIAEAAALGFLYSKQRKK